MNYYEVLIHKAGMVALIYTLSNQEAEAGGLLSVLVWPELNSKTHVILGCLVRYCLKKPQRKK